MARILPKVTALTFPVLPNTWASIETREAATVATPPAYKEYYTRLYAAMPYTTRVYKNGKYMFPGFTQNVRNGAFDLLDDDDQAEIEAAYDNYDEDDESDGDYTEEQAYENAYERYNELDVAHVKLVPPAHMRVAVTIGVWNTSLSMELHICAMDMKTGKCYRLPMSNTVYASGSMCSDQGKHIVIKSLDGIAEYFQAFESSEWSTDMIETAPVSRTLDMLRWTHKDGKYAPVESAWKFKSTDEISRGRDSVIPDVLTACFVATKRLDIKRRS